ncbi:MAG: amidohydrolase family protein [Bryobacteraceae bacterium]
MRLFWISLLPILALSAAEPADLVVSAGAVITMDAAGHIIPNGAVAVRGGRILAVGPAGEIARRFHARRRIQRPDALLTPGLVNGHTHAPMSLLRGIADDVPLQTWLERFIFPAEARNVDEAFVRAGARLAMLEMMLGGITTYADMYYFEHAIAEETQKAGMRAVLGQTIIGFPAPDFKTPQQALEAAERFIRAWRGHPLVTPAVAPHAIYTTDAATLGATRDLANRYGVPVHIHVSETKKENDDSLRQHRLTPVAYLDSLGFFSGRTILAHMVWARSSDLRLLEDRPAGIVHCPSSNSKLASGLPDYRAWLASRLPIGLGTDGPAGSNNDLNLFEEMDLASKFAKVSTGDPTVFPAEKIFRMATIEGAKVLGMEKEIGSLEPGKRADFITVSLTAPHAIPAHDPYSMLVYSLKAEDVRDVVIEGRITVLDRRPLTLDPARIAREAAAFRARVAASLASAPLQD